MYEAYLDEIRVRNGYLVLEIAQGTDDMLRFRNNIFPEQYPPVLHGPVRDETDKVQLSHPTTA
jgi:hypothetical protein